MVIVSMLMSHRPLLVSRAFNCICMIMGHKWICGGGWGGSCQKVTLMRMSKGVPGHIDTNSCFGTNWFDQFNLLELVGYNICYPPTPFTIQSCYPFQLFLLSHVEKLLIPSVPFRLLLLTPIPPLPFVKSGLSLPVPPQSQSAWT